MVRDARWKLVANRTGLHRLTVAGIAMDMLESANNTKPRGSLQDFSSEVSAVALELDQETIEEVRDEFERIGFIEQGWIAEWHLIAREKEDPGSTERSRKRRKRLAEERKAAHLARLSTGAVACNGGAGVAAPGAPALQARREIAPVEFSAKSETGNGGAGVAAPLRSDQIRQEEEAGGAVNFGDGWRPEPDPRTWLYGSDGEIGAGLQLLSRCGRVHRAVAPTIVGRWLRSGCGPDELARILMGVAEQGLSGDAFMGAIDQHVAGVAARDHLSGQASLLPHVVLPGGLADAR
jgi:hypothetical protein